MTDREPLVTLGVPVYNGAATLAHCLDALLAQTFGDFELIIADNGSTDETPRIAREYAARDGRVRCVRHERNMGFSYNMNHLFRVARGRYILCTGSKDWRTSDCLARYLEIMEAAPSVALCYGQTVCVDESGEHQGVVADELDTRGLAPVERFQMAIQIMKRGDINYGLIRLDAIRRTRLFRNVYGHDHVLMAELALQGEFAHLPAPLFHRSERRQPLPKREGLRLQLNMIHPHFGTLHRRFPFWMLVWEILLGLWKSSLPLSTRVRMTPRTVVILRRRWWRGMKKNLREVFRSGEAKDDPGPHAADPPTGVPPQSSA